MCHLQILMVEQLTQKVAEMQYAKEQVGDLKYSPNGAYLAAGSNDNFIDVYSVTRS